MARRKRPNVGQLVEICQSSKGEKFWMPFLVTHVHTDDDTISGVGFTGMPGQFDWNRRGTMAFDHVERGDTNRCWRASRGKDASLPGDDRRTEPVPELVPAPPPEAPQPPEPAPAPPTDRPQPPEPAPPATEPPRGV